MSRKIGSATALAFILIGLLAIASKIQKVEAWTGTVYIRADGSVEPADAPILQNGNLYTLTSNITSNAHGIIIEKDNVILDGASYTVEGKHAYATFGIYLVGRKNVTIRNIKIRAFWYSIRLYDSSNCNNISENTITDNHVGIAFFSSSSNNSISENIIRNNTYGIWLKGSPNNIFRNNRIDNNTYTFNLDSTILSSFINDIDTSNTVESKPIYYWINKQDETVPADAGYVALINCTHITIQNLNLTENGQSILLAYTINSTIIRNKITAKNGDSLYLFESLNNSILGNEIVTAVKHGIWLLKSSNNRIVGNTIVSNMYGIETFESSNNIIYHNNFINNRFQIYDYAWEDLEIPPSINVWSDDYPSGGNYWSNYHGADFSCGPYGNETSSDGIGDTPYIIGENNTDKYPLMGTYSYFHIASEQNIQIASNSTISNFQYKGTTVIFNVSGKSGTLGFCRICIPTALMNGTYKVFVNGKVTSYTLSLYSNSTHNYLYFSYTHSTKKVIITLNNLGFAIIPYLVTAITIAFTIGTLIAYIGYKTEQKHDSRKAVQIKT